MIYSQHSYAVETLTSSSVRCGLLMRQATFPNMLFLMTAFPSSADLVTRWRAKKLLGWTTSAERSGYYGGQNRLRARPCAVHSCNRD